MRTLLLLTLLLPVAMPAGAFDYPMQAKQVADKVYAIVTPTREFPNPVNGGWNSNTAFVVTHEGVLLFDSGSSTHIGAALRRTIASVTDQPVRWIINSHEHGDHWLGNAAFKDSLKAIYASDTVDALIRNSGRRWIKTFNEMTGGITGESEILPPTLRINEDSELTLGGMPMRLLLSGGSHSPGDLMLWLPEQQVLIAGDVVYSDRMPSTNAGKLKQWIATLSRLQAMRPKVVVPGHGEVTDLAGLERLHGLLSALWAAVAEGIEAGKSDYEMYPDVVESLAEYQHTFPGLAEKLRRDLSHVFLQVEAAAFE